MALSKAMLDELVGDCKTPQDMEKLYSQMLQHMINRSLEAEMEAHLGHERHQKSGGNPRNGKSRKTVQSSVGDLQIDHAIATARSNRSWCPSARFAWPAWKRRF